MQNPFAGQPARIGAVAGHLFSRVNGRLFELGSSVHHAGKLVRFSPFQWTVCILLAALSLMIGLSLISIRNNTVDLNANLRENTQALTDMKANIVKSMDGINREVADTNQKLFDLVAEVDDLIAQQRKLRSDEADAPADTKQKPNAKSAPAREGARTGALTVHRRRGR